MTCDVYFYGVVKLIFFIHEGMNELLFITFKYLPQCTIILRVVTFIINKQQFHMICC